MQCRTHPHLFYLIPVSVFQLAGAPCTRRDTSLEQRIIREGRWCHVITIFCSIELNDYMNTTGATLISDDVVVVHSTSFCFPSLSCTILEQRTRYPAKCRRHKLKSYKASTKAENLFKKRREKHPPISLPCQKCRDSRVFSGLKLNILPF